MKFPSSFWLSGIINFNKNVNFHIKYNPEIRNWHKSNWIFSSTKSGIFFYCFRWLNCNGCIVNTYFSTNIFVFQKPWCLDFMSLMFLVETLSLHLIVVSRFQGWSPDSYAGNKLLNSYSSLKLVNYMKESFFFKTWVHPIFNEIVHNKEQMNSTLLFQCQAWSPKLLLLK